LVFYLSKAFIVRGGRALKGLFGSDSSKAPNLAQRSKCNSLHFCRHFGKIQHGRHPVGLIGL